MAVFYDGFDEYATAHVASMYTSTAGTPTISAAAGRNGSGAILLPSAATTVTNVVKTMDAQASWVQRFAWKTTVIQAQQVAAFLDAGTVQVDLRVNADGTLSVTRNGTALTDGTSVLALSTGAFYHIEWKVTIANSIGAGTCQVYVNEALVLTVATGQDLQNTANASANQFRLGTAAILGASATNTFDDLMVETNSTAILGDSYVVTLLTTGAGTNTDFTPSAGANEDNVDDATPDDDATYNASATPGDRDTFAVANLSSTPATIHGVQVTVRARKDDAGGVTLSPALYSGGTDYAGSAVALGDNYLYYSEVWVEDPDTTDPWTEAGVNALEIGYLA